MPHAGSLSVQLNLLLSGVRMRMQISMSFAGRGQFDDENRSTVFPVVTADFSAVLLNDSVAHAQPQTNALTHGASRVKGIEDLGGVLHSWTGIRKLDVNRLSECVSPDG